MTTALKVARVREFIRVTAQGKHSLSTGREAIRDVAAAVQAEAGLLIDVRDAASHLPLAEIRLLVDEFAGIGLGSGRKTAMLCTEDRYENVKFFAVSARSMGFDVHAFTSFEEACNWLTLPGS